MTRMQSTATTYELNAAQIAEALNILEQEQQRNLPSRLDRVSYWMLNFCISAFVVALLTFAAVTFVAVEDDSLEWLSKLSFGIIIAAAASALVFFVLYIVPLAGKTWRQLGLVRRLGLSHFAASRWHQRRRAGKPFIIATIVIGSVTTLLAGLILYVLLGQKQRGEENIPGWVLGFAVAAYVVMILVVFGIVRRRKERLDALASVSRLTESFKTYEIAAADHAAQNIAVATQDIEGIYRIERSRIARERQEAISGLEESKDDIDFATLKSSELTRAINELDPAERLAVEDQIEILAREAETKVSSVDSPDDTLSSAVPDTNLSIEYSVDTANRRVKVLALTRSHVDDSTLGA